MWKNRLKTAYLKYAPNEKINWDDLEKTTEDSVIQMVKTQYDGYQKLELPNFEMQNNNPDSWPLLYSMVDFRGQTVLDIGCHYGYYSFKAMEHGARNVVGIDVGFADRCRKIGWVKKSPVVFLVLDICKDEITMKRDWTLAMNLTHHIPSESKEFAYKNIFSNTTHVFFEVVDNFLPDAEFYAKKYGFTEVSRFRSLRGNRKLIIYKRMDVKIEKKNSSIITKWRTDSIFDVFFNDGPTTEISATRYCFLSDLHIIKIDTGETIKKRRGCHCDKELEIWRQVRGTKYEKYFLPILDGKYFDKECGYGYVVQNRITDEIHGGWSPQYRWNDRPNFLDSRPTNPSLSTKTRFLELWHPIIPPKKFHNFNQKEISDIWGVPEENIETLQILSAKFEIHDINLRRNPLYNVVLINGCLSFFDYGY